MSSGSRRARGLGLALFLAATAGRAEERGAAAPELTTPAVEECVGAHDSAALLRQGEEWHEARAAMSRCAKDDCPLALRSDCKTWLDDLAAAFPTLLVVVERDDGGHTPVRVQLDGQPLELSEASPVEVLPGAHHLVFTLEGYAPIERGLTLEKGDKNHLVRVRFERPHAPAAPALAPAPKQERPLPPPATRPVPTLVYVAAGGALAAFTTSAILVGSALSSRATARSTCAPGCPTSDRESIEARLVAADIIGLVGLGLGGVAVYGYVSRPWVPAPAGPVGLGVSVTGRRVALSLEGRFR